MNLTVTQCVCPPAMSKCSALHPSHFTSLICRHFSQFMYFVCKRFYRSCEAVTVVMLGIQLFQDVIQHCLDLLPDKYLHGEKHVVQLMHNLWCACYSVSSLFQNSKHEQFTAYCICIHLLMICGYLSTWHDVSSG
jgi:hypothetical protein